MGVRSEGRQMNPEYKIVYDVMGCGLGDWWQLFRRKRFLCFTRWEYVTASSSRSEVVDTLKKLTNSTLRSPSSFSLISGTHGMS